MTFKLNKPRVLIVAKDPALLTLVRNILANSGYFPTVHDNADSLMERIAAFCPELVVTDIELWKIDGNVLFSKIQEQWPGLPLIILTGVNSDPDSATTKQQSGLRYLCKPVSGNSLVETVDVLLDKGGNANAPVFNGGESSWRRDVISRSAVMEAVLQQAAAAAASDASILIRSQAGTGKELLARVVHSASRRRDKPFLTLNCADMPESVLVSELFGYSNGRYTGTTRDHPGLFRAAKGGTVFLDEIDSLSPMAQNRLLRELERHDVLSPEVSGSNGGNVRIISATNQDLELKVRQKTFRDDLYYRLSVIMLDLPVLAQRREDILPLAEHFADMLSRKYNKVIDGFSSEAGELLENTSWPGNVRQLMNVVDQCIVLTTNPIISSGLVKRVLDGTTDKLLPLDKARAQFERAYIVRILQLTEGNVALAARLAERNRSEFYKILRRHGLEPAQFRMRAH